MTLHVSNSSLPHGDTHRIQYSIWKMPSFKKKLFRALVSGQTLLNQRVPVSFMPNSTINPSAKEIKTAEK